MEIAELISSEHRKTGPPEFHLNINMRYNCRSELPITWFTWPMHLVAEELVTLAQRCAGICDLTTIVLGRLSLSPPGVWDNTHRSNILNMETTLPLLRPAAGDWFGFAHNFVIKSQGTGVAEANLYDVTGYLRRSSQTLAFGA